MNAKLWPPKRTPGMWRCWAGSPPTTCCPALGRPWWPCADEAFLRPWVQPAATRP